MAPAFELSSTARRAFDAMAADLTRVLGARFTALVAYGPHRGAAFAESLTGEDLDALSSVAAAWHRSGLATPLLLTSDEFLRSLDAFPLEYHAIIHHHVVIAGTPPFAGASVQTEELRRACETQAKGHLIHLRQMWVDAGGHDHELAERLAASAMPLRLLLTNAALLTHTASSGDPQDAAAYAASAFPSDAPILTAVLALEHDHAGAARLLPRLPDYLAACEHIWSFIDGWRA